MEWVHVVIAVVAALLTGAVGFGFGRKRTPTTPPPPPTPPEPDKTSAEHNADHVAAGADAVVDAAEDHNVNPNVVGDLLDLADATRDKGPS